MILSGTAIRAAYQAGEIEIDPFDESRLNPASYDLELGAEVAVYSVEERDYSAEELDFTSNLSRFMMLNRKGLLDSRVEQRLTRARMSMRNGFTVETGYLYLMHTRERVCTKRYVPVLDGKSSIGRLGVLVHVTAGYGDPGFDGQYTLEVTTVAHPVRLYPGMRIAQMRFHQLAGETTDYREKGHYVGPAAIGPVGSAAWRQFG